MAQGGDPGVQAQPVHEHVLDVFGGDWGQLVGDGALGHDNNGLPLAVGPVLGHDLAHLVVPALRRRRFFWNENVVGQGCDSGHQRQPPAVTAHDLDHERPRMRVGGGINVVNGLADPVERRVRSDGGIGGGHVVVDAAHGSADVQVLVVVVLVGGDGVGVPQFLDQRRPFSPEQVGPRERAISPTYNESIDAGVDEMLAPLQAAGPLLEVHATGSPDVGPTFAEIAPDVLPRHLPDVLGPTTDQALVALTHRKRFAPTVDGGPDYGPHAGVHAGSVSAGGHHGDVAFLVERRRWGREVVAAGGRRGRRHRGAGAGAGVVGRVQLGHGRNHRQRIGQCGEAHGVANGVNGEHLVRIQVVGVDLARELERLEGANQVIEALHFEDGGRRQRSPVVDVEVVGELALDVVYFLRRPLPAVHGDVEHRLFVVGNQKDVVGGGLFMFGKS